MPPRKKEKEKVGSGDKTIRIIYVAKGPLLTVKGPPEI